MLRHIVLGLCLALAVSGGLAFGGTLCVFQQYHFVATDENGVIIDEWDTMIYTCFQVDPFGGGGTGGLNEPADPYATSCKARKAEKPAVRRGDLGAANVMVSFDQDGDGVVADHEQLSLTAMGLTWLEFMEFAHFQSNQPAKVVDGDFYGGLVFMDLNGNGLPDSRREFLLDHTTPEGLPALNVVVALAGYNELGKGGNEDGVISPEDLVWDRLYLWLDSNNNRRPEAEEVSHLDELGLTAIGLTVSARRAPDGNSSMLGTWLTTIDGAHAGSLSAHIDRKLFMLTR